MIKLFDSTEHPLEGPASHLIDTFTYFDLSAREDIASIRKDLEDWFTRFPDEGKKELKAQFRVNFSSCFFELYLHEVFIRLGFRLTVHPPIAESNKHPDFLVEGNGMRFYVEAREATDITSSERKELNRLNALYEVLDKMPSPNHFIRINKVIFKSKTTQPSNKKISKHFQLLLDKLNPDDLITLIARGGYQAIPTFRYDDDLALVEISPIPRSKEGRNKPGLRTIGIYSSEPQWMTNDITIKNAIKNKASRYGVLDCPYIVCVNATGTIGIDDYEVRNALFGSLGFEYNLNAPTPNERPTRQNDGIFRGPAGPQHTRVSAVFITNVNPGNYKGPEHRMMLHPDASLPIDADIIGLNYTRVTNGKLEQVAGMTMADVFNRTDTVNQ